MRNQKDKKKSRVLVTGGCGYIGSHVTAQLSEQGYTVVVLDNLSTGHKSALLHDETLIVGNCGDASLLAELIQEYKIDAVMHFAASIVVPESIEKPLEYYQNNAANTLSLLHQVKKFSIEKFVMSSTAAVYGDAGKTSGLEENSPTQPIHPYGRTKLIDEWMLEDLAKISKLQYVALRYFNVAGADPQLRIGQSSPYSTHLIKIACEVATGHKEHLFIHGNQYDTPDGTCIRDYVHVYDLAAAHLAALHFLENGGQSTILNCGYNRGYSILEVVQTLENVIGHPLQKSVGANRPGDVGQLIASAKKIQKVLDWKPIYNNLQTIVESSLNWEQLLREKKG